MAKDFGMTSKVIGQILTDYFAAPKNHMQVLETNELDVIFEYLTQHNQVGSIAEIFAPEPSSAPAPAPAAPAKAPARDAKPQSPAAQAPKAQKLLQGHRAPLETLHWEKETLSVLLGRQSCSMLCFTDLPLASRFAAAMADEAPQWGDTAALLARREEKAARRKAAPRKAQRGGT